MRDAEAEEEVRGRVEVLTHRFAERGRRKEGVPQRRDAAARAGRDEEQQRDQSAARARPFLRSRVERQRGSARGGGERREQEQGVGEVDRHHHGAGDRGVPVDQLEENQGGAEGGFEEHQPERPGRGATHRVPGRTGAERGDREGDDADERQAARRAVGELDALLDTRRARHHLAVAERPVPPAAGARAGGADVGPPENHQEVEREDEPGVAGETGSGHP